MYNFLGVTIYQRIGTDYQASTDIVQLCMTSLFRMTWLSWISYSNKRPNIRISALNPIYSHGLIMSLVMPMIWKNVTYCQNTSHDPGNVSDHLPVTCIINVSICPPNVTSSGRLHTAHVPLVTIKWDAPGIKAKYFDCLQAKLNDLPLYDGTSTIDHHVQQLNEAMRDAAQSAGCVPRRVFKPKPYWCPELSQLRDRKRFWWKIWVDNGRPRHGAVFDCYEGVNYFVNYVEGKLQI